MKSNLLGIFAVLFFFVACKNSDHSPKTTGRDSMPVAVTSVKHDSIVLPKNYLTFREFFEKDKNGKIAFASQIPFSLLNSFLTEKIDTDFNVSAQPMDWIENVYGEFFLIRLNCTSAGDCATYRLLVFDNKGKFIKARGLGRFVEEKDESELFSYTILSDTALRLCQEKYDNQKNLAVDSTVSVLKLTLSN
jgi:hypothetical protein